MNAQPSNTIQSPHIQQSAPINLEHLNNVSNRKFRGMTMLAALGLASCVSSASGFCARAPYKSALLKESALSQSSIGRPLCLSSTDEQNSDQLFFPSYKPPKQEMKPGEVVKVLSLKEYKAVVADEKEKMVVVKFFHPYCRACKAIKPRFEKMAKDHLDIQFVEVPYNTQTAALINGLSVPSFPFGHIYHPEAGLVEEQRINRKCIDEFETMLEAYIKGECELDQSTQFKRDGVN